jgi:hypothetical protein
MNAALERRIAEVAQRNRISFNEAAKLVGGWGGRRRAWRQEAARLTRVRRTWAWHRDFET